MASPDMQFVYFLGETLHKTAAEILTLTITELECWQEYFGYKRKWQRQKSKLKSLP